MHIPLLEKQSVVPRLFARHVSTCYYTTFFFELLKISLPDLSYEQIEEDPANRLLKGTRPTPAG